MKAFYSSFLLRIEWDREAGIIGGEIRKAYGTARRRPEKRFFRGLDLERIAEFVRDNLDVPEAEVRNGEEQETE